MTDQFKGYDADEKAVVPRSSKSPIVQPTAQQLQMYSETRAKTCGGCKDFNHDEGQKRLFADGNLTKIVLEYEWQVTHLGGKPHTLGVCGQGDGDTLVSPGGFACPHYRRK